MLGAVDTVETPCGIRAIGRPCQSPKVQLQSTGHPINSVCITPGEAVHILDDVSGLTLKLPLLLQRDGLEVQSHANMLEMKNKVIREKGGCIVLDIGPSRMEGVELFRSLKELNCNLPVIFLSEIEDVKTAVECMRAGAENYICKPADEIELHDAIVDAIAKSRISHCRRGSREIAIKKIERLTPTELEVAKLLVGGHLTKKIAAMTNRSESTVKIHRARIMEKLEVSSPATLVHLFGML